MKKNNHLILRKDYDRYLIPLPWSVVLRRKEETYVYSQLEKKHPCFGQDCYVDKKIRLARKGFVSDVVVMNKLILADYRQRFEGKKIVLEGITGFQKRRGFVDSGKVKSGVLIFISIFIFALAGIFGSELLKQRKLSEIKQNISESEKNIILVRERKNVVRDFLDVVEKQNGRLDCVEWKTDGSREIFTANVNFIYPEELGKLEGDFNNVSYENGIPSFRIVLSDFMKVSASGGLERQGKQMDFKPSLRNLFSVFKVNIIEENYKSGNIKFSCDSFAEKDGENFLEAINQFFKAQNIGINKISLNRIINQEQNDGFNGEILIDGKLTYEQGINLEPLSWRFNLLVEKHKFFMKLKNSGIEKKELFREDKIIVGEILHKDGTKVQFFKDSEGKIKREEKKYEN